jgi:hypothetical protein
MAYCLRWENSAFMHLKNQPVSLNDNIMVSLDKAPIMAGHINDPKQFDCLSPH